MNLFQISLVFSYVDGLSEQLNKAACLHSTFNITEIGNSEHMLNISNACAVESVTNNLTLVFPVANQYNDIIK